MFCSIGFDVAVCLCVFYHVSGKCVIEKVEYWSDHPLTSEFIHHRFYSVDL